MSPDVLETNREDILTPIQKFYAGANVLVTGGTGFLGKLLIEKLLRSCPELSTIYVLVRSKKGKEVHERVEELFEDAVFEPLAKQFPKFRHKIVGVAGDCGAKGLGLNEQDRQLLIGEVKQNKLSLHYLTIKREWNVYCQGYIALRYVKEKKITNTPTIG